MIGKLEKRRGKKGEMIKCQKDEKMKDDGNFWEKRNDKGRWYKQNW